MINMDPATDRILSSAPIGDKSAYDYTGSTPSDFSATRAHSDGDACTVTGNGGTVSGIQLYRVDSPALRSGAITPTAQWTLSSLRYWGVFLIGTSATCFITDLNPDVVHKKTIYCINLTFPKKFW